MSLEDLDTPATPLRRPGVPFDDDHFNLSRSERAFFKAQTGIQDDDELREHIKKVQTEAYELHPYPCIGRFLFTRSRISTLPAYEQLLRLGRERDDAIYLEMGCCFGVDLRKAISDGFPAQKAVATDLIPEFWDLGHRLFKSSPETFPVHFVPGSAFDPANLEPIEPFRAPPSTSRPDLSSLTSLNPLRGHVSAIHASLFFHLFDEAHQLHLARAFAALLSPAPGSVIFGTQGGRTTKGLRVEDSRSYGKPMFCHSPESWRDLWDGQVFAKGEVKVEAWLKDVTDRVDQKPVEGQRLYLLQWSVTRL